ncbi:MAG: OadG family protein [Bacteroidales bacterium]
MTRKFLLWLSYLLFPLAGICQPESSQNLDPLGIGMSVIAMTVVFTVLIMLYLLFKNMAGIFLRSEKKQAKRALQAQSTEGPTKEEVAAISLAINMYIRDMQEHEDMTLTIAKVSRSYSPWNSKIYGVGVITRN